MRVLIFGAQIFSFFVGVSALAEGVTEFVRNLHWAPLAVMALLLVLYLVLGLITVPIVTPLVQDLGYDLESGGASSCSVVETGLIHPPLGLNVFVLKGMVPEVPLWRIYKGVFPFVAADLVKLVILVLFPWITFVGDGHALEKPCKQVAVTGGCCGGGIGADRETQDTHDGGGNDDDQRFERPA